MVPGPTAAASAATSSAGGAPNVTIRAPAPCPAGGQALRRPLQDDAARREDHNAVRHLLGFAQLVGGEDDAHAPLLQPGHHGAHGDAALGVDAGRRLVEEGHVGPPDQGQGEREPLLLAAREVAPGSGGDRTQPDEVEQLVGRHRLGVVAGEEVEDAARPQHGVHAAALEHDPDAAAERGVVGHGIEPEHAHLAGGGAPVALERLDGRRLAGAVGPEHDEHLARRRGQVEAVDRGRRAGRSVTHGEAGDLDGWHGVADYFEQE